MMRHCFPFGQVIFKWGQVKTEIYLPAGQVDLNFFFLPWVRKTEDFVKTHWLNYSHKLVSFCHFWTVKESKSTIFTCKLCAQLYHSHLLLHAHSHNSNWNVSNFVNAFGKEVDPCTTNSCNRNGRSQNQNLMCWCSFFCKKNGVNFHVWR